MATFTTVKSKVIPLLVDNIDTDQIIPARFLKVTDKQGLGDKLFCDWRYSADGSPREDFILNNPQYRSAQILLAGDNFGCGSSREHAPWALTAFGIRAVISTTIADIFRNNSIKNGLLPVVLQQKDYNKLKEEILENPDAEVTIQLQEQEVLFPSGYRASFPIDSFSKFCLLNGVDELEYLRRFEKEVIAYEQAHGK
ncbi:MAG TPA: 3-isopropylmalate dehydratase small subunit [Bacteroidota bacterium]|jgi:3-isopropylmalate/(R)-2-methylmalate dehydratase small subunit|nr:3-isopropylmalate dehydratase small subunit [Bacteroidota bacterium]